MFFTYHHVIAHYDSDLCLCVFTVIFGCFSVHLLIELLTLCIVFSKNMKYPVYIINSINCLLALSGAIILSCLQLYKYIFMTAESDNYSLFCMASIDRVALSSCLSADYNVSTANTAEVIENLGCYLGWWVRWAQGRTMF